VPIIDNTSRRDRESVETAAQGAVVCRFGLIGSELVEPVLPRSDRAAGVARTAWFAPRTAACAIQEQKA